MPHEKIEILELTCKRCGHKWKPRNSPVLRCPNMKCQSWRWNEGGGR